MEAPPPSDFSEEVEALLHARDYEGALALVFNPANQDKVGHFGMDLITRLCEFGVAVCPELDSLTACQDMLMHVVRTVRPKEALISLLEQAEMFVHLDSNRFASLLAPLQHVMLNLPKKREHSFSWVLSILNSHIKSKHPFPPKWKKSLVRGRESILLGEDKQIKETLVIYNQFCNFYEPFVRQFWIERTAAYKSKDGEAIKSIHRQEEILRDHLVQLLADPLLHFDLHWDPREMVAPEGSPPGKQKQQQIMKSDPRLISERLLGFLRLVDQHPEYYLEWSKKKLFLERTDSCLKDRAPIYTGDDNESEDGDECTVDFSAVVNYYYLMHVQGLNRDTWPSILSPPYVFSSVVRLMYPILSAERAGPSSLIKCFLLAQQLLQGIDETVKALRLDADLLETGDISEFVEGVAYHTVYCEEVEVRKQGLQLLRQLMWKFEPKGRYDFILFILNRVTHDGVKGYIISQLKDCIRVSLDQGNAQEMREYFTGKSLMKQLKLTCFLKHGVTTDLMENKEQIICALNLILYVSIRDKSGSLTGFGNLLGDVKQKMLEPLYRGLELSRAHYHLKLKELDDPKLAAEQLKEQKKLNDELDVMLNHDQPLNLNVSISEQRMAIHSALGVFDVMNSVLARVNEMCDGLEKTLKTTSAI